MSFNPLAPTGADFYSPRLAALGRAVDSWLDVTSPFHNETISALQVSTGYSQALVEQALNDVFGEATLPYMTAYLESLGVHVPPSRTLTILHITAGNVFTAWLHGAIISVLLGHRVWIKPSSQESVFPHLWRQSVVREDARLAHAIRIVPWTDTLFSQVDAIIAYGADETLATLKKKAGKKAFAGFGHKASAAVVFKEAFDSSIDAALRDIKPFDLDGCLSPQVFYIEGDAAAFEKAVRSRHTMGIMPTFKTFKAIDEVWRELSALDGELSCVGIAGSGAQRALAQTRFKDRPSVRVCALGEMQRPHLSWRNGGVGVGEFLLKYRS